MKNPWAKAGAYMGLAFVVPASGYAGYWLGSLADRQYGTAVWQVAGMLVGLAAGVWEVYRQAVRIEGNDRDR